MNHAGKRPLYEGWRWVRLGTICEKINYGFTASADFTATEPRFLRITDIQNGKVNWETVPGCRIIPRDAEENSLADGDIVFARTGGTTGKTLLIEQPPAAVFASYLIRMRLKKEANPEYIYAFFQSNDYWQQIRLNARGGAQPNLNATLLSNLKIPLPPLTEQKRIATILNEQMATVERARAATQAQLEAARALPAAYLREVFNSPEAQKWPRKRLGEVCRLLPSKSISTNGDVEVCAITTACLSETGFQPSGVKRARMNVKDVAECKVSSGEILVARSNTPELVGRVAMFEEEPKGVVASDLTIRLFPDHTVNSFFLAAYLSFLYSTGYWKERAGGASGSMKKITRRQIQEQGVPIPSLAEQRKVAAILKELMMGVRHLNKVLQEELEAIGDLPTNLLRRAFSGNI